jgi:hypothetical protein
MSEECDAYIEGVVAGIRAETFTKMVTLNSIYSGLSENVSSEELKTVFGHVPTLCLKPEVPTKEIAKEIFNYMSTMPGQKTKVANLVIYDALQSKYGCAVNFLR